MICVYHADADGRVAAQAVKALHNKQSGDREVFVPVNYGDDPFRNHTVNTGEIVYIVDFSIKPEHMKWLRQTTGSIVWIDHHQTAIDKYRGYQHEAQEHYDSTLPGSDYRGVQRSGIAGCMLTAQWLMERRADMGLEPFFPMFLRKAVKYVADQDIWEFAHGEDTVHFCAGLNSYTIDPGTEEGDQFWSAAEKNPEETVQRLMDEGKAITRVKNAEAAAYIGRYGYETTVEGHKAFVVNHGFISSATFDSLPNKNDYRLFAGYAFDGQEYKVSLRANDPNVDVSAIAVKYGGGGHKGAAGFQVKTLPFAQSGKEGT